MAVEAKKVRVYEDASGDYRWTAYDSNGEPVADSNEGYTRFAAAKEAATDLFPDAEIVE